MDEIKPLQSTLCVDILYLTFFSRRGHNFWHFITKSSR